MRLVAFVNRQNLLAALVGWAALVLGAPRPAAAQERAYFVTYDHYLEEPGNLEVALATTYGFRRAGRASYFAPWLELEYGVKGWWTTELYLEAVSVRRDAAAFTGWRWENRFRPLKSEHRVTPVIYVEYERINEASRIQKEVVGDGGLPSEPVADLRRERAHELEAKLILSSATRSWNISENFIVEKNLSEDEGLEFGYSIGVSRPVGLLARPGNCRFCPENLVLGVEVYGGLGTSRKFGVEEARHYIAPVLSWHVAPGSTLKFSSAFGLGEPSDRVLLRFGWSYEVPTRKGR